MPQCIVYGCSQQWEKGVALYRFPRPQDARYAQWVSAAHNAMLHRTKHDNLRVCTKHFAESAFEPSSLLQRALMPGRYTRGPQLRSTAVPTLCLPPKCCAPGHFPCNEEKPPSKAELPEIRCKKQPPRCGSTDSHLPLGCSGGVKMEPDSPQNESMEGAQWVQCDSAPLSTVSPSEPGSELGSGSIRQQLVQQVFPHATSIQHTRTVPSSGSQHNKLTRPGNPPNNPEPPCRFECAECLACYRSKPSLRAHLVRTHLSDPPGTLLCCEMCPQRFRSTAGLSRHVVSVHISLLTCCTCGALSPSLVQLRAHYSEHHGQKAWLEHQKFLTLETNKKVATSTNLHCFICERIFNSKCEIVNHILYEHFQLEQIFCSVCKVNFWTDLALTKHLFFKHSSMLSEAHKIMKQILELKMTKHKRNMHDLKYWTRFQYHSSCFRVFQSSGDLLAHYRERHGSVTQCELCRKRVAGPSGGLEQLQPTLRLLQVEACTPDMLRISNMASGACFQCMHCFIDFTDRILLRHHVLEVHHKVTRFKCAHCSDKFYRREALDSHLSKVHGSKEYTFIDISPLPENFLENFELNAKGEQSVSNQSDVQHAWPENMVNLQDTSDLATLPASGSEFMYCNVTKELDPHMTSNPDSAHLPYFHEYNVGQFERTEVEPSRVQVERVDICEARDELGCIVKVKQEVVTEEVDLVHDNVDFAMNQSFQNSTNFVENSIGIKDEIVEENTNFGSSIEIYEPIEVAQGTMDGSDIVETQESPIERVEFIVKEEGTSESHVEIEEEQLPSCMDFTSELPEYLTIKCEPCFLPDSPPSEHTNLTGHSPSPDSASTFDCVEFSNQSQGESSNCVALVPKPSMGKSAIKSFLSSSKKNNRSLLLVNQSAPNSGNIGTKSVKLTNQNKCESSHCLSPVTNMRKRSMQSLLSTNCKKNTQSPLVNKQTQPNAVSETTTSVKCTPDIDCTISEQVILPTYTCTLCSVSFKHQFNIVSHNDSSHHTLTVQCFCGVQFYKLLTFQQHLILVHKFDNALHMIERVLIRASYLRVSHLSPFLCPFCKILHHSNFQLIQHIFKKHENFCYYCGIVYNSTKSVSVDHFKRHLIENRTSGRSSDPGTMKCALCNYKSEVYLVTAHIRTHVLVDCRSCTESLIASTTDSPEQCVDCVREGRLVGQHDSLTDIKISMQLVQSKTPQESKKTETSSPPPLVPRTQTSIQQQKIQNTQTNEFF